MLNCVKYNNNNYQLDLFDDKIKFLKDYLKDDYYKYEDVINSFNNTETNDSIILQSREFKEFAKEQLTLSPDKSVEEILEYYKICKKGGLKAKDGIAPSSFTKGGKWEIYEIFEGKSHKQGGIDINIKNNQISFTNKNGSIKAKYGLVIPKDI